MRFEWDENKRAANLKKHELDLFAARKLFDGRRLYTYSSPHGEEARFVSVGILEGIDVAVVWMVRDDAVRLISLRRARDEEKRTYRQLYDEGT
jgi:uncharacterized DUF497 family protein